MGHSNSANRPVSVTDAFSSGWPFSGRILIEFSNYYYIANECDYDKKYSYRILIVPIFCLDKLGYMSSSTVTNRFLFIPFWTRLDDLDSNVIVTASVH